MRTLKIPKFEGDAETARRELRAFAMQVAEVLQYLQMAIEELQTAVEDQERKE